MTDIEKIIYDAIRIVAKTDEPEKFAQMNKTVFEVAKTVLESLPKLHGWVARDKYGSLNLFGDKPTRFEDDTFGNIKGSGMIFLNDELLPEITWESEPVEVELLVRKI